MTLECAPISVATGVLGETGGGIEKRARTMEGIDAAGPTTK